MLSGIVGCDDQFSPDETAPESLSVSGVIKD